MIRQQRADRKEFSTPYSSLFIQSLIGKTEATSTSETLHSTYKTIRRHSAENHVSILDTVKNQKVPYECLSMWYITPFFTKSTTKLLLQTAWLFNYILKSTESYFLSSKDLFSSFTESSNLNVTYSSLKHLFNHCVVASKLN